MNSSMKPNMIYRADLKQHIMMIINNRDNYK